MAILVWDALKGVPYISLWDALNKGVPYIANWLKGVPCNP